MLYYVIFIHADAIKDVLFIFCDLKWLRGRVVSGMDRDSNISSQFANAVNYF